MRLENLSFYTDEISHIDHLLHKFIGAHFLSIAVPQYISKKSSITVHCSLITLHCHFTVATMEHQLNLLSTIQQSCKGKLSMRTIQHHSSCSLYVLLRSQNNVINTTKFCSIILRDDVRNQLFSVKRLSIRNDTHCLHLLYFSDTHLTFSEMFRFLLCH